MCIAPLALQAYMLPRLWYCSAALTAADDVEFSFARSGGAGGQNVNKVHTASQLLQTTPSVESFCWELLLLLYN